MFELLWSSGLGTMVLLAGGTFVTEDLTSIGAGVLVASGEIDFPRATLACFAGIYAGDLLLFLAGRRFGPRVLALPLATRFVTAGAIQRSAAWLERRGPYAVFLTRVLPGTRLPTYLAGGALGVSPRKFAMWLAAAAAVWTPLLVGLSTVLGAELAKAALRTGSSVALAGVGATVVLWSLWLAARRVTSWRGRRRLYGTWRRWARWEFWPVWVFYVPVIVYILWLMCRHRSVTAFAAANPGIPGGGFVGESKFGILMGLAGSNRVARAACLPADVPTHYRQAVARLFMRSTSLTFPVVLKPDQGARGSGVVIVRDQAVLQRHIAESPVDLILQEYVAGPEFGIFYTRLPGEARGRIFSMTEKRFPAVVGDGRRSLEELVLADARAVCHARLFSRTHAARWHDVPQPGERIDLVEVGSHCRGTIFLDGRRLVTPALAAAIDAAAKSFDGFFFGRFDVRSPSADALQRGEFYILELNGVTSEATHIYDPANSVLDAYRVLFEQWRLAFAIGEANLRAGARLTPLRELIGLTANPAGPPVFAARRAGAPNTPRNLEGRLTSNPA